jgi:hypothetical protein
MNDREWAQVEAEAFQLWLTNYWSEMPLEVAQHVLWAVDGSAGDLAVQPGRFVELLMQLIAAADESELQKLARSWPAYVIAYRVATREEWGLARLRALARVSRERNTARAFGMPEPEEVL